MFCFRPQRGQSRRRRSRHAALLRRPPEGRRHQPGEHEAVPDGVRQATPKSVIDLHSV